MSEDPIEGWHAYMVSHDPAALSALLDDEVVFESPVVHTPQRGKSITQKYLLGAAHVLGGAAFRYTASGAPSGRPFWNSPLRSTGSPSMAST